MRRRLKWALIANILIVIFEIIGAILSVRRHGIKVFTYYTENSNYFALFTSTIFVIDCIFALKNNREINAWVHTLRFITTVCLSVTIVVVLFVLIPMYPTTAKFMLIGDSNLYQHSLCPILSILSYFLSESSVLLTRKHIFMALIPTIIYGVICIILNLLKLITGPYPFFYLYKIPWYVSTFSLIGILLITYLIILIIYITQNKIAKYQQLKFCYIY